MVCQAGGTILYCCYLLEIIKPSDEISTFTSIYLHKFKQYALKRDNLKSFQNLLIALETHL